MLKLAGECASLLLLLVVFAIVKVLYWIIMGIKIFIALVISLN